MDSENYNQGPKNDTEGRDQGVKNESNIYHIDLADQTNAPVGEADYPTGKKVLHFLIGFFSPLIIIFGFMALLSDLISITDGLINLVWVIVIIVLAVKFMKDRSRRFIGIGLLGILLLPFILGFVLFGACLFMGTGL